MAWETESSPFTYDGLITGAEFGHHEKFVDPESGEPRTLLLLTVATSLGDERTEIITTGNGWDIGEGGETVSHPTRTKFSDQSSIGKFIDRILAIEGVPDVLAARTDEFHAASYVGLEFHWESEPVFNSDGTEKTYVTSEGETRQSTRMVPVSLISAAGSDEKKPAKKAPAKKAAAAKVTTVEANGYEPEAAVMAKLVKFANKADDHEDFTDTALTVFEEEVASDKDLEKYILDEANWTLHIGV